MNCFVVKLKFELLANHCGIEGDFVFHAYILEGSTELEGHGVSIETDPISPRSPIQYVTLGCDLQILGGLPAATTEQFCFVCASYLGVPRTTSHLYLTLRLIWG